MLELAGQSADGVVLVARSDLATALAIVEQAEAGRKERCRRIYMDRIAYTPALRDEASALFAYVLMDLPPRLLEGLGVTMAQVDEIRNAMASGGPQAALAYIRPEVVQRYQLSGTPDECRQAIAELVDAHDLDAIVMNVSTGGRDANWRLLNDIREIAQQ